MQFLNYCILVSIVCFKDWRLLLLYQRLVFIIAVSGTDLYFTFVHEIGHSLGIYHSKNGYAVMAPFYKGFKPDLQLHQDDIDAVQALYGEYIM